MERITRKYFRPGNTIKLIKESVLIAMYDKLYEYEEIEEQGLLVRLPFRAGDTVYLVEGEEAFSFEVAEMRISAFGVDIQLAHRDIDWKIWTSMDKLGEKYFLTKEEAERALRIQKENENE